MCSLQLILLLTLIPWFYCDEPSKENNLTTRNNDDGTDKQPLFPQQSYQPVFNSDNVRPILVQRYPYLVPDERLYQGYAYKGPSPMKYPSWPVPAPVPWPPKFPAAKPEDDKEDLEKSFLKVLYPAIIIFAIGSVFIPILIFYNYKSIYGLAGGGILPGGCNCALKKDDKRQRARLGRSQLINNLINLMVTIEKSFSEVERKFVSGTNKQNISFSDKVKS